MTTAVIHMHTHIHIDDCSIRVTGYNKTIVYLIVLLDKAIKIVALNSKVGTKFQGWH